MIYMYSGVRDVACTLESVEIAGTPPPVSLNK
jgi:hypothetical protein